MQEIQYAGETLWIGVLSRLLIYANFATALAAVIALFTASKKIGEERASWFHLGKIFFASHGIGAFVLIGLMFYSMVSGKLEYSYVYDHVSDDLPMKYILSAFWEGQEGSFLLWMFWHIILGFILFRSKTDLTPIVLGVIAIAEVFLSSMLLGVYLPFINETAKIGSNPMTLIREMNEAPIFNNAEYLSLIKGRGLNPLLQNYWMTIHPPTLFLGFASTIIPFGYAIAGLMTGEHKQWLRPAMYWALFSAGILGVGILMGSFWAYEALSFGGYWAWDPVENTSLVPWIILVAGVHTNMIANNTGRAVKSTYLFYLAGFVLIIYSTLLTRSGILGDTSAHAFTEMGLEWQLTSFFLFFVLYGLYHYFTGSKTVVQFQTEENLYSREFWMFMGSLVLLFSSVLITASSSLPVFNTLMTIFDDNYVGRVIKDPIAHYNKYQLWIGVLVSFLAGGTIFLRYKEIGNDTRLQKLGIKLGAYLVASIGLTYLLNIWSPLQTWYYTLLSVSGFFVVIGNIDYIVSMARSNFKLASAATSHMGFGLMLIGLLTSGLNGSYLNNPFVFKGMFEEEGGDEKYVQLIKNKPLLMKNYLVTYESDTLVGKTRYYTMDFKKVDKEFKILDSFKTRPNAVYANDFSKVAAFNPDTRHYLTEDIFTCVVSLPPSLMDAANAKEMEDTIKYQTQNLAKGEWQKMSDYKIRLNNVNLNPQHPEYVDSLMDFGLEIEFSIFDNLDSSEYEGRAAIGLSENLVYSYPWNSASMGLRVVPNEELLGNYLKSEDELDYQSYTLPKSGSVTIDGVQVSFGGVKTELNAEKYGLAKGDLGLEARIILQNSNLGTSAEATPKYFIKNGGPMSIKSYVPELGWHVRLVNIDPAKEEFSLRIAKDSNKMTSYPVNIAENLPRTDYLILEAKIFPGINLYWAGTVMMMLGLLMAFWVRLRSKSVA